MRIKILLICLFPGFYTCIGQVQGSTGKDQLFLKGIYLENLNMTIPWEINFSDIKQYGNPKLTKDPNFRNCTLIKWDYVKMLNGITLNLQTSKASRLLQKNGIVKIRIIRSSIDSLTSDNLISSFNQMIGHKPIFSEKRKVAI